MEKKKGKNIAAKVSDAAAPNLGITRDKERG